MNRFMYFVLGALSGAVVGGLTGLLLTPYSGDQMRNRITDYVDQVETSVKRAAEERRIELKRELEVRRSPDMEPTPEMTANVI